MCSEYGNVVLFKAYFSLDNNAARVGPQTGTSFALESAGITAVHHPEKGSSTLATDALCFWVDNISRDPLIIIFVTLNPALLYTAAALKARSVDVGLIIPTGRLPTNLFSYASWVREWKPVVMKDRALGTELKTPPAAYGTVSKPESARTTPSPEASVRESIGDSALAGSIKGRLPPDDGSAMVTTQVSESRTYEPVKTKIAQPLQPVRVMNPLIQDLRILFTTVHTLQIFETDPLYINLIRDPEAIRVKAWRRQLKQMFYHESNANDPQAPGDLETLFSGIERYDKMTRNYLAFSRIGKLMTQISQSYQQDFDYRRSYMARAKALLVQWEKLIHNSES